MGVRDARDRFLWWVQCRRVSVELGVVLLAGAFRNAGCLRCACGDGCVALRQAPARAGHCETSLPIAIATRARFSRRLLARRQEARKNIGGLLPLARFALQLLLAGACQF